MEKITLPTHIKNYILTAICLVGSISLSFADGTKGVMPDGLEHGVALWFPENNNNGSGFNAPFSQRIFFKVVDATENFHFGVKPTFRGTIPDLASAWYQIKDEAGNVVAGPFNLSITTGDPGYINVTTGANQGENNQLSYQQAVNGPNIGGVTNGYVPITYNPSTTGDFYIEFWKGVSNTDSTVTLEGGDMVFPFFDFNMADASGNLLPGRVFNRKWTFLCYDGLTDNLLSGLNKDFRGTFFGYTTDEIIVQIDFENGFRPFGYVLALTRNGVVENDTDLADNPSGGSVIWEDTRQSIGYAGDSGNNVADYSLNNGFPVFITSPDTTAFPPGSTTPPALFGNIYGCPGNYFIPVFIAEDGDIAITLDLNGVAGYQPGSTDIIIESVNQSAGNVVVPWDGLDGTGSPVGGNVAAKVVVANLRGRTCLPVDDAELNIGGVSVNSIAPVLANRAMFWDDTELVNITNGGNGNTTGVGVARRDYGNGLLGPTHKWNGPNPPNDNPPVPTAPANGGGDATASPQDDFGNIRIINTWFYGEVVESGVIDVVLPNCDNDTDGIPDDMDVDDDNDGVLDLVELNGFDPDGDADGDGVPDYIDPDFAGFIDANRNGIDDRFDSDGDGIINSFDADSDADGCSDAFEAGATTNTTTNFEFTDLGGDADGLSPTVDPGGDGQPDYSSTYYQALDGVSACVDQCDAAASGNLDSDTDNVSDSCDLDDDNDGILDADEVACTGTDAVLGQTFNSATSGTIANVYNQNGVVGSFTYFLTGNATWNSGVRNEGPTAGINGTYINVQSQNTSVPLGSSAVYQLDFTNGPIYASRFKIGGLDNNDIVIVTAENDGANVPVTLSDINLGGDLIIVGQTAESGAGGNNAPANSIQITINSPVTKITLKTGKNVVGDPNNVTLQLFEFSYCMALDTDTDNNPDYLDNDSDGDGCSDADEAYADENSDADNNGFYGSGIPTVNSNGLVIAAGVTGSTYNTRPAMIASGATFQQGVTTSIDTPPANQSAFSGQTATFTANASTTIIATVPATTASTAVSYQWQLSVDGGTAFADISGASGTAASGTAVTYTTPVVSPSDDGNIYKVIFINEANICVEEASATLTIDNSPPNAVDDDYSVDEDDSLVLNPLDLDTDVDGDPLTITSINDVALTPGTPQIIPVPNGTVATDAAGVITFTPDANYNGAVTFPYEITDGTASATANENITVNPINDAPIAVDDSYTVDEDDSVILDPLVLDSDLDGDTLIITSINGIALTLGTPQTIPVPDGTVTTDAAGVITFNPDANYNGAVIFPYEITDGTVSATANQNITVNPINDAPVAVDDSYTVDEDDSVVLDPLVLDSDLDGDTLIITSINDIALTPGAPQTIVVTNGTVSTDAAGVITFTPDANYNGAVTFPYEITDGTASATANQNITVAPINDAPVAVDDSYTVDEDDSVILDPLDLDSDLDGDTLTITSVNDVALTPGTPQTIPVTNGTVSTDATGVIRFTPDANYNGAVTFPYEITDGTTTATANENITVNPINDAPVAVDDGYTVDEDRSLVLSPLDLDTDLDEDTLSITSVNGVALTSGTPQTIVVPNGTVTTDAAGVITFSPDANYNGVVIFPYEITDGTTTATANQNITVNPINDAPVAVDDSYTVDEDDRVVLDPLALDSDLEGDPLSLISINGVALTPGTPQTIPVPNGIVSTDAAGVITFTPNPNYNGAVTFPYEITDGTVNIIGNQNITVEPVNDAPIAVDDVGTTDPGVAVIVAVLPNDTDIDEDVLTVNAITREPDNGTVTINSDGTITYTPNPDFLS